MSVDSKALMAESKAKWIWPVECGGEVNQYIEFRHKFELDTVDPEAVLVLSVDTNYVVWINGKFVNTGQYTDYPDSKTYDELSIGQYLRKGRNILAILAYYCGEDHFSYIKDRPGLAYALQAGEMILGSGEEAYWRISPCYCSGPMPRYTPQLGFVYEYDAQHEDGWQGLEYSADDWCPIGAEDIALLESRPLCGPRPVEKLVVGERVAAEVVAQGVFRRFSRDENVAQLMQQDYLSPQKADYILGNVENTPVVMGEYDVQPAGEDEAGTYLVIDLGREECGHFELQCQTDAGVVVDVAFGQHLNDLRVAATVGVRNFASRYICRDGMQTFTHYLGRWGCRYLQLHIGNAGKPFRIYYAGVRPADYPLQEAGTFESSNGLYNRIYDTSARTLCLCMHDHYEDTPWREQGLYANDARNQALAGYNCFGNYTYAQASIWLLGQSVAEDGFVGLCAPAETARTIPSFSLTWILSVCDNLTYSGDIEFASEMLAIIRMMFQNYLATMTDDLMPSPQGDRYWHFYDWADGLDGTVVNDRTKCELESLREVRYDAPLNLFLLQALDKTAELATACSEPELANEYTAQAEKLRVAIHETFWDAAAMYRTYVGNREAHYAELTQSLAIFTQTCSRDAAKSLISRLTNKNSGLVATTLSQTLYKYEAILTDPDYIEWVFDDIEAIWGGMLFQGATSFWETVNGGWEFDNAGSLCHGWSAIPGYLYQTYIVGVKPASPGFASYEINPSASLIRKLGGVSANIPTPHGMISIRLQNQGEKVLCQLQTPEETIPSTSGNVEMIPYES